MALNRNSATDHPAGGARPGACGVADRLVVLRKPGNAVEERSLTSGAFLEETNSPEIGFAYQLH